MTPLRILKAKTSYQAGGVLSSSSKMHCSSILLLLGWKMIIVKRPTWLLPDTGGQHTPGPPQTPLLRVSRKLLSVLTHHTEASSFNSFDQQAVLFSWNSCFSSRHCWCFSQNRKSLWRCQVAFYPLANPRPSICKSDHLTNQRSKKAWWSIDQGFAWWQYTWLLRNDSNKKYSNLKIAKHFNSSKGLVGPHMIENCVLLWWPDLYHVDGCFLHSRNMEFKHYKCNI